MMREPELFCDGASGIYIPQRFATEIAREKVTGVSEEDYATLERGPEEEGYWETWENVVCNAKITTSDGTTWFLWQDGDLWVVPKGYENDDFFGGY